MTQTIPVAARLETAIRRREAYLKYRQELGYATKNDREMTEDLQAMRDALTVLESEPGKPVVLGRPEEPKMILPSLTRATTEQRYKPHGADNPYAYANTWRTDDELKEIARWYPYSLRTMLIQDGNWIELGRFQSREKAYQFAQAYLATKTYDERAYVSLIMIKCTRQGNEGREIPVLYYPDEQRVASLMSAAKARRIRRNEQGELTIKE